MSTVKFEFSVKLQKKLSKVGNDYFATLHAACVEASDAGVTARNFPTHLRGAGFPCSTGSARAAYKAVRNGADVDAMSAVVDAAAAAAAAAARATRAAEADTDTDTDTNTAAAADTDTDTATDTDTLAGALTAALAAAKAGHIEVVETWLTKAQALIDAAKQSTTQAIEKMGGIVEKAS